MPDGVIQEAFFNFLAKNYFKSDKGLVVSVEQVTAFRNELIERIIEEFPLTWHWKTTGLYLTIAQREKVLSMLIGDNK